jgi:phage tail-like protein
MESANGTQVNGQQLPPKVPLTLPAQAEIKIEGFRLFYQRISVAVTDSKPAPIPEPEPADDLIPADPGIPDPVVDATHPLEPAILPAPEPQEELQLNPDYLPPPGLTWHSERLLQYLPDIYHTDFVSRFLALFESILIPIKWNIENFDLFLTPGTAPPAFLLWLSKWFDLKAGAGWDESKQRIILSEAHRLYARRGSPWALKRVLEIYLQHEPEIVDQSDGLEPFTFKVILPLEAKQANQDALRRIIMEFKPAYTNYLLEFKS